MANVYQARYPSSAGTLIKTGRGYLYRGFKHSLEGRFFSGASRNAGDKCLRGLTAVP